MKVKAAAVCAAVLGTLVTGTTGAKLLLSRQTSAVPSVEASGDVQSGAPATAAGAPAKTGVQARVDGPAGGASADATTGAAAGSNGPSASASVGANAPSATATASPTAAPGTPAFSAETGAKVVLPGLDVPFLGEALGALSPEELKAVEPILRGLSPEALGILGQLMGALPHEGLPAVADLFKGLPTASVPDVAAVFGRLSPAALSALGQLLALSPQSSVGPMAAVLTKLPASALPTLKGLIGTLSPAQIDVLGQLLRTLSVADLNVAGQIFVSPGSGSSAGGLGGLVGGLIGPLTGSLSSVGLPLVEQLVGSLPAPALGQVGLPSGATPLLRTALALPGTNLPVVASLMRVVPIGSLAQPGQLLALLSR